MAFREATLRSTKLRGAPAGGETRSRVAPVGGKSNARGVWTEGVQSGDLLVQFVDTRLIRNDYSYSSASFERFRPIAWTAVDKPSLDASFEPKVGAVGPAAFK